MWAEIILSLLTGFILGAGYVNFDIIRPYLALYFPRFKRKLPRRISTPAVHATPCQPNLTNLGQIPDLMSQMTRPGPTFEDQVKEFEDKHNSRVIFINHGRQKNSVMGVDLNIFGKNDTLCKSDAQALLDILRETPEDKDIDLILHTEGGEMASAEVIVKALLAHSGQIRVHVPYYAESAGTFIALTGDELYLGQGGWLTQVDPQMGYFSAASLLEYTQWESPSWFGELTRLGKIGAGKAMKRAEELMEYICQQKNLTDHNKEHLIELLVNGKSNHDKPLTRELLEKLPNIQFDLDPEVMKLYQAHCSKR